MLVKNISVLGLQVSDYRDREPAVVREVLAELLRLHADGRLRAPIAATFPLERAASALVELQAGGVGGRLVLTT